MIGSPQSTKIATYSSTSSNISKESKAEFEINQLDSSSPRDGGVSPVHKLTILAETVWRWPVF